MKYKTPLKPLSKHLWSRGRSGQVVCQCGKGYGSELDGLCFNCRGGITAYEAAQESKNKAHKCLTYCVPYDTVELLEN